MRGAARMPEPSCRVTVRVIPRAARPGVDGTRGGAVLVRIGAAPVDGAANAELIDTLSTALGVPRRQVVVVSGATARLKTVRIEGLSDADVQQRLGVRT